MRPLGDCREGQIPRSSLRNKFDAPSACCGVFDLLPFINQDTINKLAYRAVENGRYDDIEDAAPSLEQKVIVYAAKKMIADRKNIEDIAPFIEKSSMGELACMIYGNSGLDGVEDILAFIPREVLQEIAEKEYERDGQDFEVIAPFLDKKYLNEIAIRLLRDKRTGKYYSFGGY